MGCNRSFVLGFKGAEEISAQQMADRLTRRGLEMLPVRVTPPEGRNRRSCVYGHSRCLLDDILVLLRGQNRITAVPPFQLAAVDPMNRPPKTSPTDIIGWRWAIASELRTATESSHLNRLFRTFGADLTRWIS